MALGERAKSPSEGSSLYLGTRQLSCVVCGADEFAYREVMMNTSGLTFLDLDWANKSALGAVCTTCGFVHAFMGGLVELL
jgi:hypothetical protein